jgi:hypothetical protein
MHARGLRLRRVRRMLAITHPPVLPSAMLNDVGTPIAIISQLNTLPALPPVNASMAASRLATHDSGPGWLATPFLYDFFIHNSTPVCTGALRSRRKNGNAEIIQFGAFTGFTRRSWTRSSEPRNHLAPPPRMRSRHSVDFFTDSQQPAN